MLSIALTTNSPWLYTGTTTLTSVRSKAPSRVTRIRSSFAPWLMTPSSVTSGARRDVFGSKFIGDPAMQRIVVRRRASADDDQDVLTDRVGRRLEDRSFR